jgi:hypothetical protein
MRIPSAKGDPIQLERCKQVLGSLEAVRQVTGNPILGTVVIHYDPQQFVAFPGQLLEAARQHGLFPLEGAFTDLETKVSVTDLALDRALGKANQGIQRLTGNAINLKELFPFSILFYAVFFVDRAIAASQWLSWVQFAFSRLLRSRARCIEPETLIPGLNRF